MQMKKCKLNTGDNKKMKGSIGIQLVFVLSREVVVVSKRKSMKKTNQTIFCHWYLYIDSGRQM